ncbi:MAG: hypothetical protein JWN04_5137, partial [Myxococcaceae bacterium]|nr:hypothetical protein [Myxococcaceae bacterium]
TSYKGIAADESFLWVFGTGGFACVTHSAVLAFLDKKQPALRWIEHYPNKLLYAGLKDYPTTLLGRVGEEPELKGLIDMSACDDGSLFVSASTRRREDGRYVADNDGIHVATYDVDLANNAITVDPWRAFGGGFATKVQKLPIYCWRVLESLQTDLALRSA